MARGSVPGASARNEGAVELVVRRATGATRIIRHNGQSFRERRAFAAERYLTMVSVFPPGIVL